MSTPEEAKAKAEAEAKEKAPPSPEPTPEPKTEPEPTPKPELKKGESKGPSVQELQQQLSTTQGLLKQAQGDLSELRKRGENFEGLRSTIETQGQTLELITDVLGSMAEDNEELQTKVKQSRETREKQQKQATTFKEIMDIASKAGLSHESPEMESVRQAFLKGDYESAKQHTFLTVIGKISEQGKIVPPEPPKEPEKKEPEKTKLPVNTSQSAAPQDWREDPPKKKIQDGLRQHREES